MGKKEQELDLNMLDEVFGLNYNDLPEGREPENNEMEEIEVNYDDPVEILKANIKKANIILRGLRAVSDFDYEFQMALTNRKMAPEIETIFFMTDYKYSYLSSNFVKQIAHLGGDISEMVPPPVAKKLKGL